MEPSGSLRAPPPRPPVGDVGRSARARGRGTMDTDALFEELYRDLRRIASARMRGERAGHTLQTTALLSEAYLRLAHTDAARWTDRQHFLRTAARVMRRILIDHGRKHSRRVRLASALETECGIASDGI